MATVNVEDGLKKQLDDYCENTGKSRKHVVNSAISTYLQDKQQGGEQ